MTIKEIEELSGMARANIRFYETEGLLHPERGANGYRIYSEEDLKTLRKIRLLRSLHLRLEDIRAVSRGEQTLEMLLSRHIARLREEEKDMARCREICEELCREHAEYGSLDAGRYLEQMRNTDVFDVPELEEDRLPKVTAPWRRFFARSLDMVLYGMLWNAFLSVGLHMNITKGGFGLTVLDWLAGVALTGLIEPVLLAAFGTTPGKLIFGLRVAAEDGSRLSWVQARSRTWLVLRYGLGFNIPVYSLVRIWKSWKACRDGQMLEWEEESVLAMKKKDTSGRRALQTAVYIAARVACAIAGFFIVLAGSLPLHRGSLSVAEFCENYNKLQDYYGIHMPVNMSDDLFFSMISVPMYLDENAEWQFAEGTYYVSGIDYGGLPELQFEGTEGDITGVSFSLAYRNEKVKLASYGEFMAVAAVAFICAQEEYSLFKGPFPYEIYFRIRDEAYNYDDFSFSAAEIRLDCQVDWQDYERTEGGALLTPEFGGEPYYMLEFSMRKVQ